MRDHVVLRVVVGLFIPFILLFGLYVQFHGEYGPGGGFQAGVICAAAFIVHALIYGLEHTLVLVPLSVVKVLSSFGLLMYVAVGVVSIVKGGKFLDYSVFHSDKVFGQQIGIWIVELAIGLTVFSVMMLIFYIFAERSR